MNVFIATPTMGGIVQLGYVNTLVRVIEYLNTETIAYGHNSYNGAEIVNARNYLANQFLQERECSHILFIDSDMDVEKNAIEAIISRGGDFVGGVCPLKHLDFDRYFELARSGAGQAAALSSSLDFNIRHAAGKLTVDQGFCKLRGVGFGFVLISRQVFEDMVSNQTAKAIPRPQIDMRKNPDDAFYDFFSRIPAPSGEMLSEDYSFCERALSLGVDIQGWIGPGVGHSGTFRYSGSYLDRLRAQAGE